MTDERKALYRLANSRISVEKQNKLLEIYGSALELFSALPSDKVKEYVGKAYENLLHCDEKRLDEELHKLASQGVRVLLRGYPDYPELLNQKEVQPPTALYAKGNVKLLSKPCLCVVGTRRCTDYGKRVATEWTAELAEKFVIVSGHATGIDTYAVKSCLASGGSAIIVLACGLDAYEMPDFMRKADPDKLLLITEYPTATRAIKFFFQERNRILSGLSSAVLVVESAERSGTLITASKAVLQNRYVFAVPGNVFSDRSKGTNALIREGAIIATSVHDIFEDLGVDYKKQTSASNSIANLTTDEMKVYEFLCNGARHFDEIAMALKMSPVEASTLLSVMELEGIIEKKMQNYFALSI